ncbi:Cytochrome P450 76C4 [Morus notabilis]|uniref:Cytochrome P450 76C4 n=1 Tax=Morus notabilis TaxID=981085 RepID=W9SB39_9ROSA|nr:(S)-N-methylcoclaurine 3'-hydroxylase isozyme 1 [Morus notabilis]EXC34115.1 Cytochrome P450 76C4 [Morus notabilis]
MAELIKNPRCMKILQEELIREIGRDRAVKESDLPKLTYLQACLKEILRLHPAGPLILPHRAAESCIVMDYTFPKDSQVLLNFWAIGRNPSYWEDPLEFKPERFLNSSIDFKGNDFEYFPFGSGRRFCPGMPMVAKQIPLMVASFIHSFDWSLPQGISPNDIDMTEKYGIAMGMKQPLLVVPKAEHLK